MTILTQKIKLPLRVDVSTLVPAALAGLSVAEIEKLPLRLGSQPVHVADVFSVAKGDGERLVFRTQDTGVEQIGAELSGGEIVVEGDAGIYAGRAMSGGTLRVNGNVGDFAGVSKSGGLLWVAGNGGDFVGAALPGRTSGVSGGAIVVEGSVGCRFGDRIRRGVVAALGNAGDFCGARAIAGTIWVRGQVGKAPAQGMKRATVLLEHAPPPLPTFQDCGVLELPILRLLLPSLDKLAGTGLTAKSNFRAHRHLGCIGVDGRGEVLVLA